ncbi:MAG: acetyl-CoA carboxylase biotin carboxyl carrier protein [Endomicrobiales bacterium]
MKSADNERSIKEQVNELYKLMLSENLEELEIKEDSFYLYLKRKGKNKPMPAGLPHPPVSVPVSEASEASPAVPSGETVKSPITGMLYRAPSPSMPPFVKEGDVVDAGKTLCIVEAMKVMNEIKSESRIKILRILVENGKPITASQDLFVVEKA